MYLEYAKVTNKTISCYEHIPNPQKRMLLRKLVDSSIGRALELKYDLTNLEKSEFLFLDNALLNMRMQPRDLDIKVPEYFEDPSDEKRVLDQHLSAVLEERNKKYIVTEDVKFVKTAKVFISLLQAHERARQSRQLFCQHQKRFILRELKKQREERKDYQNLKPRHDAAITIQRAWRLKMLRKSLKKEYNKEMKFLDMLPKSTKRITEDLERNKLQILRRNDEEYQEAKRKIKERMMSFEVPEMMEKLEDRIRSYFYDYKLIYGKFLDFPTVDSGGSLKMFETSVDFDVREKEKADSETSKDSKSEKTESQKSDKSKKSTEKGSTSKGSTGKESTGKGSAVEGPIIYSLKPSKFVESLVTLRDEYQKVWFGKNIVNYDRFDMDLLTESVSREVEEHVRLVVDEKMRAELQRLTEASQKDTKKKKKGKKGKKGKGKKKGKDKKKKGKKEKDLTPDRSSESLIQELVTQGIITAYPKYRLSEFIGDFNYTGCTEALETGNSMPCLGDVRRIVNEYCILPMISENIHSKLPFAKSVLLAGPKGVGKKSLVYAICNEINATMIDLSAETIEGKYPGKEGKQMLLHLVTKVGRLLQPTIIFIRDAENYFYKKKPASCKLTEPGRLKKDFPKFVKGFRGEDRIMVCGTSVYPFDVDQKGLTSSYEKIICIMKPDYNCRRRLWREMIGRQGGAITRKLDTTTLCSVSDGFTASAIEDSVAGTLTDRRLAYQDKLPLSAEDFLGALSQHVPVYDEEVEAYKKWMEKLPLGKKRMAMLLAEKEDTEQEEEESEEED